MKKAITQLTAITNFNILIFASLLLFSNYFIIFLIVEILTAINQKVKRFEKNFKKNGGRPERFLLDHCCLRRPRGGSPWNPYNPSGSRNPFRDCPLPPKMILKIPSNKCIIPKDTNG
jgi:hypothetical protein